MRYTPPAQHADTVKLFAEAGAQTFVLFDWLTPFDATTDNKAKETREMLRYAALAVVESALQRARAWRQSAVHLRRPPATTRSATSPTRRRLRSTTARGESIERASRRQSASGAKPSPMASGRTSSTKSSRNCAHSSKAAPTAAETTTTPFIANDIARSVDENSVYTSPATDLALFNDVAKGMTVQNVSAALREAFSGDGPLVFVSSASPLPGGEAAVTSALADADKHAARRDDGPRRLRRGPMTAFGVTGKVASRATVDDLGVTFVRFANGVTPDSEADPVPRRADSHRRPISVRAGSACRAIVSTPAWALGGAFVQGGLERYRVEDLQRRMADKVWGALARHRRRCLHRCRVSRAPKI